MFTGGHRVNGRWLRPDPAEPAKFVDASGAPIRLTAGQTIVELAPLGIPVTSRTRPRGLLPARTAGRSKRIGNMGCSCT